MIGGVFMSRQEAYKILMYYVDGIGTMEAEYWSDRKDQEKARECLNILMFQKEDDIKED